MPPFLALFEHRSVRGAGPAWNWGVRVFRLCTGQADYLLAGGCSAYLNRASFSSRRAAAPAFQVPPGGCAFSRSSAPRSVLRGRAPPVQSGYWE